MWADFVEVDEVGLGFEVDEVVETVLAALVFAAAVAVVLTVLVFTTVGGFALTVAGAPPLRRGSELRFVPSAARAGSDSPRGAAACGRGVVGA